MSPGMTSEPSRIWWSAAEIAARALPDLPETRQGVEALAKRAGWRGQPELARRRSGRGGGWEYHWTLLPVRAQRSLLAEVGAAEAPRPERLPREEAWAYFEALPEDVQTVARRRLEIIQKVEALAPASSKYVAAHAIGDLERVGVRTIWSWFALVEGVAVHDRLPYLAPRHRAAPPRTRRAGMDPEFFDMLRADYLRPAAPSFSSCYRRAVHVAGRQGWQYADERTARRRLNAEVSAPTQVLTRKGLDALKRLYPPQVRDKSDLYALAAVNADFHKFDVFARWPDGTVSRPQMVAFQDIYSGRILSWRIDLTPNSHAVRLAAGDMIEDWGIPEHVLLDNGREFAAKALTGGAPTRYRFTVREEDLPGLFVSLGCEIHWATPYSGQSKPIERAFRDMCDAIAKDPRFDGAYTGNRPNAKPEDYGSRAVPLDRFLEVLAEGIEEHNTRPGRWSDIAAGRSFAEVFDASYASAPIRRASEAQRRYWLMGAEGLRGATGSGLLKFLGNEYWAPWMTEEVAGERVIARFDPADLWAGLHVYSADNRYLGLAPCKMAAKFFDIDGARAHARARRAWVTAERAALEAHRKMKAADVAALLDGAALPPSEPASARVVRPVFGRPADVAPDAPRRDSADLDRVAAEVVADLAARRAEAPQAQTNRDRYRRALSLRARIEGGERLPRDDERWLIAYLETPEYAALARMHEDFGDQFFG